MSLAHALERHRQGRLDEALILYRRLLVANPAHADALHLTGLAAGAVPPVARAVRVLPAAALYRSNLCDLLRRSGQLEEAVGEGLSSIILDPAQPAAHANHANALWAARRHDEAFRAFGRSITLLPTMAGAHSNLGIALKDRGRVSDALAHCRAAIALQPDLAESYANLGAVEPERRGHDASAQAYSRALRLDPGDAETHSNLIMCLNYRDGVSSEQVLIESLSFSAIFERASPIRHCPDPAAADRRLRVGYVSGDFAAHPVGWFFDGVVRRHDRQVMEIFCYSSSGFADAMTDRLQAGSDHWRGIAGVTDAKTVEMIRADRIDILVDLSGHTALNRLPVFARKPAPVQISWLGYWGTTGLAAMDYVLSDETTAPAKDEKFYRERVLRLAPSRFCYAAPDFAPMPVRNREKGVTFGSFNNLAKIDRVTIELWARVLQAVPDSRLMLKWRSLADPDVRARLERDFAEADIPGNRLDLQGAMPHMALLGAYAEIDVALDPVPFSGGTTTCEALWMGVPLVTLPGHTPPSRQSAGILRTLGLTEWIAASPEDYVRIAAALAVNPALDALRHELRPRMAASPLCDGASFAHRLEGVYRDAWRRWCANP